MTSVPLLPCAQFEYEEPQDELIFDLIGYPTYRDIEPSGRGYHKIVMEGLEAKEKKVH